MSSSRPKKIFGWTGAKLNFTFSLVLLLSTSILFALLFLGVKRKLEEAQYHDLEAKVSAFSFRIESEGLTNLEKGSLDGGIFTVLVSPQGETLFTSEPSTPMRIEVEFLKTKLRERNMKQGRWVLPETYGNQSIFGVTHLLSNGSLLIMAKNSDVVSGYLQHLLTVFSWLLIPLLIFSWWGGFYLSKKILQPIRDLIATMKKIESGSLSSRVSVDTSYHELEELKSLSNKMLDKIESSLSRLKEAFDHLAHDIRTPVTRLRGRAELALATEGGVETYREALQSCYENSDRILNFLQVLTDITEAENRSRKLKLEKKMINDLVDEIMGLYEMSFEDKKVQVIRKLDPGAWAFVDSRLIKRVVANLVDNAFKYSSSGGEVTIETINQTESVILRVTDTGPGIAFQEQSLIWEKLYRSDKSRSEHGMGLGLTFVRAVVEAHDGKVSVRSPVKDGRGTEFEVYLQKMS